LYLRKNEVVSKAIIMDVEEWGIKLCVPKYDFKGVIIKLFRCYALRSSIS
jgi:hypothetical protein